MTYNTLSDRNNSNICRNVSLLFLVLLHLVHLQHKMHAYISRERRREIIKCTEEQIYIYNGHDRSGALRVQN